MNITDFRLHHIGVAVADIARAADELRENGFLCGEKIFDPLQRVNVCFAEKPDEIPLELVEPAGEDSPVSELLKNSGGESEACFVCYAVPDVEAAIRDLRAQSWLLVKAPVPAVACGNAKVAFLFSKDAGLIELLEQKNA